MVLFALRLNAHLDLTYCTNVHSGETWDAVKKNIEQFAPALKQRLSPEAPFGIGMRLGAQAATELRQGSRLADFRQWLDDNGCYVALLNGFPYGQFHGAAIKEQVFAPDWRTAARLDYTRELIEILRVLLPEGMDGGISTMPLGYKPALGKDVEWKLIHGNLANVVLALERVQRETGVLIHLDMEPEPNGLLESTSELIAFFSEGLAAKALASTLLNCSEEHAQELLLRHLHVCFDTCHLAVKFEDVVASLMTLQQQGIRVGRVQLSSALRAAFSGSGDIRKRTFEQLRHFAESTYLHQTVVRSANGRTFSHADLPGALQSSAPDQDESEEWRVHYHVPLFVRDYEGLSSTQDENIKVLRALREQPAITTHIEIETYTWDVLPAGLKTDLVSSIEREYRWVMEQMRA